MIETSVLPSGIRLVTETMADVRSVAVAYWVGSGSRDESDELAGASHFLEHLLFKGTPTRSAAAIAESLDEVGGDCNAFTTKEYTTFYVRLLSEHLPLGLDILSEIMWDPALRPSDVDAERTVILDEILMHADEPADLVAEQWQSSLFPGHALGRDTLGTPGHGGGSACGRTYAASSNIITAPPTWWSRWPATARTTAWRPTSNGGSPAKGEGPLPPAPLPGPPPSGCASYGGRPSRPTSSTACARCRASTNAASHSPCSTTSWAEGCRAGCSKRSARNAGWPTRCGPNAPRTKMPGHWPLSSAPRPDNVDEVLRIVTGELELLAEHGITDRELAVAKGNLRAEMLLSGEDSGARMGRIGAAMLLHGEVLKIDEVLARIEAVDREAVQARAQELVEAPRTLSAVGPFDEDAFADHVASLAGH